jgi:hypothetical protein
MRILITGVTETHNNHPKRASSTKFVSIPELMREAFIAMGHEVTHDYTNDGTDLSRFDKVFLYLYPLDHNAVHPEGPQKVLRERMDAIICLDDWSFQKIMPSWQEIIDPKDLQQHVWLAPLFPWGDVSKMGLPVDTIKAWDPSPLYDLPGCHHHAWWRRKSEWYNASLSKDAHDWATAQNLSWPIHSVGGKALGQPRLLESDVVWQYGEYKGVLCPAYAHAGCGWWRVRYLHAAHAGAILGGDPAELGVIGPAYSHTLRELEALPDDVQQRIAAEQALSLRHATKAETLKALESILL